MDAGTTPRILIAAPNVSARGGGESIIPLHYYRILRKRGYDVHLLAHDRNREELTQLDCYDPDRVHFVPDTRWHKLAWRALKPFPERVRELIGGGILTMLNSHYQGRIVRGLARDRRVDIIHQPTPVSPRTPSGMHKYGLPLVIGPMNGGMDYPPEYEDYEAVTTRNMVGLGRRAAQLMNRIVPGKHRAATLLVANERTRNALPDPAHPRVVVLPENGVDLDVWHPSPAPEVPAGRGLRLAYIGRLVRWKGLDYSLRALDICRKSGVVASLDVIGDGPERAALQGLSAELGLDDLVRFHGFRSQPECARIMAGSDCLILSSLRECGGAVVLEAMASGLPVIATDWGGPQDYVSPETGILVAPVPRADFPQRLADAIMRLAGDPESGRQMGISGARIAREEYNWDAKVDRVAQIYAKVLAQSRAPVPGIAPQSSAS